MQNRFNNTNNLKDESLSEKITVVSEIPEEMPKEYSHEYTTNTTSFNFIDAFTLRETYVKAGMIGFVSWRWINPLVQWINGRKCLEIMAGRGWLSHALRLKGINVKSTDNFSWQGNDTLWGNLDTLTDIENIDAVDAVEKYGFESDIVICSFPQANDTAFRALKKLYEVNPNAMFVFIGELNIDICANRDFFNHFNVINDKEFLLASDNYQSWSGFPSHLLLGRYKLKQTQS